MIKRCLEVNIPAIAITDHGSMCGTFNFIKAKKKMVDKLDKSIKKASTQEEIDRLSLNLDKIKSIKQILGCELYLCPQDPSIRSKENGKHSHLVVLAKNKEGWKSLLKLTAQCNRETNFYKKPRTSLKQIGDFVKGDVIAFSGHMGSDLANCIFSNIDLAYDARSYDAARALVDPKWKDNVFKLISDYQEVFGKENFFVEIQKIDEENLPAAIIVNKALSFVAKKAGVETVATADSHYPRREDSHDQWVVLCNFLKATLAGVRKELENEESDIGLGGFFRSNNYHIPSPEEMAVIHTEEELKTSLKIADMCEEYSIFARPSVPKFDCPGGIPSTEYLRQLSREGFKRRIRSQGLEEKPYIDRVKEELHVFGKTDILSDYLLIVQDYVDNARKSGNFVGPSRGSAGGCLTSYLIGITGIDPILYDLSFARFYNDGRNTADRVSLPDIDADFANKELVIAYARQKWGEAHVSQMGTFQRMMGRSVLKDVLRVHNACSPIEQNQITNFVPDEAEIADELQEMDDPSIVRWALQNNSKDLKDWCWLDEKGQPQGRLSKYFAQAMRLEGLRRAQGKHASGVIISDFILDERFPMVRDKSAEGLITGIEMADVEDGGGAKFDILGVSLLLKVMGVSQLLATGRIDGN
jgi:DNA polymerase-3 subunit alpha